MSFSKNSNSSLDLDEHRKEGKPLVGILRMQIVARHRRISTIHVSLLMTRPQKSDLLLDSSAVSRLSPPSHTSSPTIYRSHPLSHNPLLVASPEVPGLSWEQYSANNRRLFPALTKQTKLSCFANTTRAMKPCFVSSTPLPAARNAVFGVAVCTSPRPVSPAERSARTPVRMVAEEKKKESLMDWLYGKFMHNALWDGDEEAGYELFFKEAMDARDERKRQAYEELENGKK